MTTELTMNPKLKSFFNKVEKLGWSVDVAEPNRYNLSKFSPAGQDFHFLVEGKTKQEIIDNIYEAYSDYDVSYEAYLWLDSTGHGVNGAPYEMKDVVEDMECCEQMILDLYNEIK